MILDSYFARRFFWTFAGVFAVFLMILGFINLIEQLRRFARVEASFGEVFNLALLSMPQAVYTILPLIMIIAAITLFLGLARSSEMVVTRSAGRGAVRALLAPVTVALAVGIVSISVLNPIVAATSKQAELRETQLLGQSNTLAFGETGIWLRQGDADGQSVIHARAANLDGTSLREVTFLRFDTNGVPDRRIAARAADLRDGAWHLSQAKVWPLGENPVPEQQASERDSLTIPSTLTADQIRDSFGTPSSIPIWELPAFIERLKSAGFSAQRHQVWLQMELALPLFLVSMVLIGAAFTIRHPRGGRTGLMVMFAILLAFALYFLRNFAQVLGENGQLPALLAAWAPPLAAIGLSMGLLLHHEDG